MTSNISIAPSPENGLATKFSAAKLLRFAFPTILMMIFFGLYTIIDTIFVARYVGTDALSAINIVTPVIGLIVGLGTMMAAGGSALIAWEMGNGRNDTARQIFSLIVLVTSVAGCIIALAGLIWISPLLHLLGASELLMPLGRDYLGTLFVFVPANMMQVLFASLLITAGRPGLGMLVGVAGGLANILFDYLFIVGFSMGIRGAALATGIGYLVPAIAGLLFFWLNRRGTLFFCRPKPDVRALLKSAYNGSSEMIGQASTAITVFLFNMAMMDRLGEDGVAAITIMIYSQFLLSSVFIGFSMGVAPVISYLHGQADREALRRVVAICLRAVAAVSIAVTMLLLSQGWFVVGLFAPESSHVHAISREGFLIFPYAFLFIGTNIFFSALFTALSNGTLSVLLSFCRNLLIACSIVVMPRFLGVSGLWLAVPFAECASLGLAVWIAAMNRQRYGY
ncbi:MATE family efflux transporter [uncultured Cohaesibacter sp.]|uniref:MATE family efflux transporter n=1 Tax=uncultured Cohaesibacter sp. TaxID=1002546 RepID=UPI002931B2CE|nr:MATE family efflux transporter [uncultured Cohaesibacter sp.]